MMNTDSVVSDRDDASCKSDAEGGQRKIVHIDMDAFFASVEQRDFEEYRGKPIIVGGPPDSRGVVAACSYEARAFGVHSAMPSSRAYRKCPQAIFVYPRFDAYREASEQIQAIFKRYTAYVEPLSLDEAFLDVSGSRQFQGSATLIANDIRRAIFDELQLTASAGVSYNKFLAKLASDRNKPNGSCIIKPGEAIELLESLAIRNFYGVGRATEGKMHRLGIRTGLDLKALSKSKLQEYFGKQGLYYYNIVRGVDHRPVNSVRVRKSIGAERTFQEDIQSVDAMLESLDHIADVLVERLKAKDARAKTLTLKLRYENFESVSRSVTPGHWFFDKQSIVEQLPALLQKTQADFRPVRLLGLSTSHLWLNASEQESDANEQLNLL